MYDMNVPSTQGARKVQSINHGKCVLVQYEKCIAVQWYRRQSQRGTSNQNKRIKDTYWSTYLMGTHNRLVPKLLCLGC